MILAQRMYHPHPHYQWFLYIPLIFVFTALESAWSCLNSFETAECIGKYFRSWCYGATLTMGTGQANGDNFKTDQTLFCSIPDKHHDP